MSIPTSSTTVKVLSVKQYPVEELVVLLDKSPAVVTLRDVKMYTEESSNTASVQWPSMGIFNNSLGIHDICEGCDLTVVEFGVWNVKTSAIHGGRVVLSAASTHGSVGVGSISSMPLPVVVLPSRRKRTSMQ
jgi:hypothetical protein